MDDPPVACAAVPIAMASPPLAVATPGLLSPSASAAVSPMTMLPVVCVPLETALVAL